MLLQFTVLPKPVQFVVVVWPGAAEAIARKLPMALIATRTLIFLPPGGDAQTCHDSS